MSVDVFAADEQSAHAVDTMRWVALAEKVLHAEGVRGEAELSVLFVDELAIADLNKRFLGKDGSTDVLAFPIDEDVYEGARSPDSLGPGPAVEPELSDLPTLLGDVVVCPEVVGEQWRGPLVHALLHLVGYDHGPEMETREAVYAR